MLLISTKTRHHDQTPLTAGYNTSSPQRNTNPAPHESLQNGRRIPTAPETTISHAVTSTLRAKLATSSCVKRSDSEAPPASWHRTCGWVQGGPLLGCWAHTVGVVDDAEQRDLTNGCLTGPKVPNTMGVVRGCGGAGWEGLVRLCDLCPKF
ncbi:hypothetical protein CC86DRAFT_450854 [Ophiobolus disseminans]|uniref:Uncharacterized protein n=1 Tax=Ophiobolus disseminans TaxID=1469910 RepID=A0A6A7AID6_9PLEO|nr:hypothetical protein CC86DRAFT_450854 [Ophiobolus disseminans]